MIHKIVLPKFFKDCPNWWQNFIKDTVMTHAQMSNKLVSYGAIFNRVNNRCYIEFETESDAVAFILKWA